MSSDILKQLSVTAGNNHYKHYLLTAHANDCCRKLCYHAPNPANEQQRLTHRYSGHRPAAHLLKSSPFCSGRFRHHHHQGTGSARVCSRLHQSPLQVPTPHRICSWCCVVLGLWLEDERTLVWDQRLQRSLCAPLGRLLICAHRMCHRLQAEKFRLQRSGVSVAAGSSVIHHSHDTVPSADQQSACTVNNRKNKNTNYNKRIPSGYTCYSNEISFGLQCYCCSQNFNWTVMYSVVVNLLHHVSKTEVWMYYAAITVLWQLWNLLCLMWCRTFWN